MRRSFPERLSCTGKRRFETWARAARAAKRLNHEHDETLEPYACSYCNGVHLAHRPKLDRRPRDA